MRKNAVIALAGNPNSGKTTLFNRLTGSRQHVGNFPGVTVEKKEGLMPGGGILVDLPGLYALSPYSPEERAARAYLAEEKPDAVIQVADAGAPVRSLYLTFQLMETGCPLILALNMMDEAAAAGRRVDAQGLSRRLGIPVVPICAKNGQGVKALLQQLERLPPPPRPPAFPREEEARIAAMYSLAESLAGSCVSGGGLTPGQKRTRAVDRVVLHRVWGLPLLFAVLATVFWVTFGPPGRVMGEELASGIAAAARLARAGLTRAGVMPWLRGLVCEGILPGVGSVFAFLPAVLLLFFQLAVLEDSGYMARIAFLLDAPLRCLGLSGRAAVPLLLGFGCTVPAAMAARILPGQRERSRVLRLLPFVCCSAKLPVFAAVAGAFWPRGEWAAVALYAGSLALGLLLGWLTAKKGERTELTLELPAYRMPGLRDVGLRVWERAWAFVSRAFGVLLLSSVAVWVLQHVTVRLSYTADGTNSLLAAAGAALSPLLAPLGFGDARAAAALVAGLAAKEAILSCLGVLTAPMGLEEGLRSLFTPAGAVSFLTFTALYAPCTAACAALGREMGARRRGAALAAAQTGLAWGISAILYRILRLLGVA